MNSQGTISPEDLKKKYRPLVIQQLQKGVLPQQIKPRLLNIGLGENDAANLINEAIAAAAPALGAKSAAVRLATGQAITPEPKAEIPEYQKKYKERKAVKEKLVQAGFDPVEAEKMAHTQVQHIDFEQTRQKLIEAGFSDAEAERMAKSKDTSLAPGVSSSTLRTREINEQTRYATFWDRLAARLIDGLVLCIPMAIIQLIFALPLMQKNPGAGAALFLILGYFVQIALLWYYFASQESGLNMATIGKTKMGIIVINENGERLSFPQATVRFFGKWASTSILFFGYFMVIFTKQKRALHDYIAGTLVIKE